MPVNKLFTGEIKFIAGAMTKEALPKTHLPEVAFIGRSNVGKSSLINAVLMRKSLARVSHTPGRTRQLNFFSISDKLIVVDLPGFGFAKVSKKERNEWSALIIDYLQNRSQLKLILFLVDARRGLMESDLQVMEILDKMGILYRIVLTKIDKLKKAELDDLISFLSDEQLKHASMHPDIIATSSSDKKGLDLLRSNLVKLY